MSNWFSADVPEPWQGVSAPTTYLYMVIRMGAAFPIGTIEAHDDIDANGWAWTMYGPAFRAVRITTINDYVGIACANDIHADEKQAETLKARRKG